MAHSFEFIFLFKIIEFVFNYMIAADEEVSVGAVGNHWYDVIEANFSILMFLPESVELFSVSMTCTHLCLYHSLPLLPLKRSPSVGPANKGRRVSTITALLRCHPAVLSSC